MCDRKINPHAKMCSFMTFTTDGWCFRYTNLLRYNVLSSKCLELGYFSNTLEEALGYKWKVDVCSWTYTNVFQFAIKSNYIDHDTEI